MDRAAVVLIAILLSACIAGLPAPTPTPTSPQRPVALFLPACADGRPQAELDLAGLPPLLPMSPRLRCLRHAAAGGSGYDAGVSYEIELDGGRSLGLYERRGTLPVKPATQRVREGTRDIAGTAWTWAVLENGLTILVAMIEGVHVELSTAGDESQVGTLAEIARSLRSLRSLPIPPARELCASLRVSPVPFTVAAAFDSTAAALARWEETAEDPGDPRVATSDWRRYPADEPVALCYLDGDFGTPRVAPPGLSSTPVVTPNYSRAVYLVGLDRRPIGRVFGSADRIPIRDPGR